MKYFVIRRGSFNIGCHCRQMIGGIVGRMGGGGRSGQSRRIDAIPRWSNAFINGIGEQYWTNSGRVQQSILAGCCYKRFSIFVTIGITITYRQLIPHGIFPKYVSIAIHIQITRHERAKQRPPSRWIDRCTTATNNSGCVIVWTNDIIIIIIILNMFVLLFQNGHCEFVIGNRIPLFR